MSESEPAPNQTLAVYVSKDGQPTGPFSIDQLRAMVAQGSVPDSELAWHEGATGWIPVAELLRGSGGVASITPPPLTGRASPRIGLAGAIIGLAGIPVWIGVLVVAVTGQHSGNESMRMTFMGLSVI